MQALRNRASLPGLGSTRCSRSVEEAVAAHHQLGWADDNPLSQISGGAAV